MVRAAQNLGAGREAATPPYLESESDHTSDSDEDPNFDESEPRPRREASKRARAVIANACGARNKARSTVTPSPKRIVKKELAEDSGPISVEDFFMELEEDLKYAVKVKVETKSTVVKKLEDEPDLTDDTSSSSSVGTPFSDVVLSPASARKRPREIFDCVLLTSRKAPVKRQRIGSPENPIVNIEDLIELDPTESSEDDEIVKAKMKKWKNDKVKKSEALCLLPETLRARIRPIGFDIQDQYITVDKLTQEHMVTRQFMSQTYGGSSQEVSPKIGALYLIDHNMVDFFYMNTEFQPEAPEVPGAPGLWFSTVPATWDIGVQRVITKIKDKTAKNDNKWLYMGQYDLRAANPMALTVAEWRAQPAIFQDKWAQAIVTSGWGAGVCVRLQARKLYNRNPTKSEWKRIAKTGSYKSITKQEVKDAYLSGREQMGVWTAKCVGYDNAFQQDISQRFTPNWRPRTKEEQKAWEEGQKEKIRLKEEEQERIRLKKEEEKQIKLEFD